MNPAPPVIRTVSSPAIWADYVMPGAGADLGNGLVIGAVWAHRDGVTEGITACEGQRLCLSG